MWAAGRFDRAAEFVSAARRIGFQRIELNPQVSKDMLQEIMTLHDSGAVSISSVHAPCPTWPGPGPIPELSALDESVRVAAVGIIKAAIDLARRLDAHRVVVHSGRVDVDVRNEETLRRLCEQGEKDSADYRRAMLDLMRERAEKSPPHLEATMRSLQEVQEYARGSGVRLGLETRYHYYEIPLPEEVQRLLGWLDPAIFGYWHDVGHANNLEVLGFLSHEEWLSRFGSRLVGIHLHDARRTADHRPVGMGDIDFEMVRKHVPPGAVRVCEFNSSWPEDEVEAAFNRLKGLGLV